MRIVFVHPKVGFEGHSWEALGIGYLAAYLKSHLDTELDIEFYSGFYDSDTQIVEACQKADLVGFSCTSPQYKHGIELARQVKTPYNRVVFGGIHSSALPELVLAEDCVDAVVQGEGETAIRHMVQELIQQGSFAQRLYCHQPIQNLDEIPFPNRALIKNERNIQQAYIDNGLRITSVQSSRGCPFRCSFCCSHTLWGHGIRFRSAANVLDEAASLIRDWNIDFLKFSDDTFTVDKRWTMEFCRLKVERGIEIPYGANAHINTIDEEMLEYMARSQCSELWYGVESGSPRILQAMHKNIDVERIKRVFRATKEYGIKTRAYFLLGMPEETLEDIRLTEKLCDELEPDIVGFTLLAPFPTNEYYDYTVMKDWDWSSFDEYSNDWVTTRSLSNLEIKREQKRLAEKYRAKVAFRHRERK